MRRALVVVGYVFQAGLGLILLGLAAIAPAAAPARPADRPPAASHTHGPSLP
jgi:hypothetical protein